MKLHIYHIEGGHGYLSSLHDNSTASDEPIVINVRSVKDAERILRAMATLAPQTARVLALLETDMVDHENKPWCDYYYVRDEYVRKAFSRPGVAYTGV